MTAFEYRVYGRPAAPGDAVWDQSLPLDRRGPDVPAGEAAFTYGIYFQAARAFLEGTGGQSPKETGDAVCIDLQKHGAFYHPAKVTGGGFSHARVLNVAVSDPGRALLARECDCLERLHRRGKTAAIPRVYARGDLLTEDGRPVSLFLGEWFSGCREFHISEDGTGRRRMIVWDEARGNFYLQPEATAEVYRQAADILTDLYDAETFDQVHPWHHGAGDFVATFKGGAVSVKLITVRGYGAAMAQPGEEDPATLLQGLLLFLLHLSIWTRLDRLDGVGDVVWSDPSAVEATVTGFFGALERKPTPSVLPESLSVCFRAFLTVCTPEDLMAVAESLVDAYPGGAPETLVIRAHLADHAQRLHRALAAVI